MSVTKHKLFLVTAICGLVIGAVIMGLAFYQYIQLLNVINAGKVAGVTFSPSITNAQETNYDVIIISSAPLIILSVILFHRSLRRLRDSAKKRPR